MAPSRTETDLALLQGIWEQVGLESHGVIDSPDRYSGPGTHTRFEGNEFSVVGTDGKLLLKGTVHLDATTIPRQATWIDAMGPDKGRKLPGIYSLSGDNFVFVAARGACAVKPTDFRAEQPGQTLRRFVRRPDRG